MSLVIGKLEFVLKQNKKGSLAGASVLLSLGFGVGVGIGLSIGSFLVWLGWLLGWGFLVYLGVEPGGVGSGRLVGIGVQLQGLFKETPFFIKTAAFIIYYNTLDINTTVSTCSVQGNISTG